ncbi:MAG: adenosylhomocysteinase [Candidatus Omnitrophica bacterium]|nr:adenosylhomocysteinase [Candidatus Omnitrophota bacterium]MBU1048017.1 adenosylhomocysteinase [Candidatus Omnitrophota bacterium]MBU1630441.1 adenosylhomocysteinase [Candidatus Omnitrophota bacterium]MBU1767120.1 adenosylhomocysteinase [Candidatus Omnitrophota bacterium]MBU1889387.1 adenosylhomocysteinase [Candidatus Omnitrophota bacterium]
MDYDIKDISLAEEGKLKIEWANKRMPVLALIRERFKKEKPLKDLKIGACLHVTSETANLMITLKEGGASVELCASNPLSTQDEVAASLVKDYQIPVFAIKGEDRDSYYQHIQKVLDSGLQYTMDDGADLVSTLHSSRKELLPNMIGGSEETTTGVIRMKAMEKDGKLPYPLVSVNDANTKYLFDNRYGTGQSTIDGILRATNKLLAGSRFVVCGYGWCGRGIASRAKGLGARVTVTEVSPLKALEAIMDGFEVKTLIEACPTADVIVTATGDLHVVREEHFMAMKDGAILSNSGHFNVEIDIEKLEKISKGKRRIRGFIDEYTLENGNKIHLLGEGRLVNLACAEGHPSEVMDMSFANQALSCEYIKNKAGTFKNKVYPVPKEIDDEIARLKLESMNTAIDVLTPEQEEYLASWDMGT